MKENYLDENSMVAIMKSMSPEKQQLYMNLYKIYRIFYANYNLKDQKINSLDRIEPDTQRKLSELEDKIYTINGQVLTQRERIILELKNIYKFIQKNDNKIPTTNKQIVYNELKSLNIMLRKNISLDNDMIKYFKKKISLLQAYLGMNIKFYNEALEAFDEQVLIAGINNNTNLKLSKLHEWKGKKYE